MISLAVYTNPVNNYLGSFSLHPKVLKIYHIFWIRQIEVEELGHGVGADVFAGGALAGGRNPRLCRLGGGGSLDGLGFDFPQLGVCSSGR
jgi:hypothetical protein